MARERALWLTDIKPATGTQIGRQRRKRFIHIPLASVRAWDVASARLFVLDVRTGEDWGQCQAVLDVRVGCGMGPVPGCSGRPYRLWDGASARLLWTSAQEWGGPVPGCPGRPYMLGDGASASLF